MPALQRLMREKIAHFFSLLLNAFNGFTRRFTRKYDRTTAEEMWKNVCNINYSWRTDEDYGCEKKNVNPSNWGRFGWIAFISTFSSYVTCKIVRPFQWFFFNFPTNYYTSICLFISPKFQKYILILIRFAECIVKIQNILYYNNRKT